MEQTEAYKLIAETIRSRRTCKNFDGSEIQKSLVTELLDLAVWAPNHRLNEPWRFRVLTKSGVLKLIGEIKNCLGPEESKSFEKTFEKLTTAGAILYVTCLKDSQPIVDQENFAATSALIQNLLLGATALKLQSYWGTGKIATLPTTVEFLKIEENERFVGWIWLGRGEVGEPKIRTPASQKTIWFD